MIWILFFLLAFLTVFFSIRLSFYADEINKTTKINKALIGGILLAGITSLPELIACFSSIALKNPYLAIGDVFGSNLFNIAVICFLDFVFIRKLFFNKAKIPLLVYFFLLINYFFLFLSLNGNVNFTILSIGLPTIIIIINYIIYLIKIPKEENIVIKEYKKDNYLTIKFIVTTIFMIITSILLTFVVNKIAHLNPNFSSSLIGAILLGITTSLPEVVTFITLIKLNNYDLAILNIIGSNLFNVFVLAIGDIVLKGNSLYNYSDKDNLLLLKLCFITTVINLLQLKRKKRQNKILYFAPSLIIILIYLSFWIFN